MVRDSLSGIGPSAYVTLYTYLYSCHYFSSGASEQLGGRA